MNRRSFLLALAAVPLAPLAAKPQPLAFHPDSFNLVMPSLNMNWFPQEIVAWRVYMKGADDQYKLIAEIKDRNSVIIET